MLRCDWLEPEPEGVAILDLGSLPREELPPRVVDVLVDPEERTGCSFLVALPELPPPVRRFWLCASKGVVHIIAMQSISTTVTNLFIILKCLGLYLQQT